MTTEHDCSHCQHVSDDEFKPGALVRFGDDLWYKGTEPRFPWWPVRLGNGGYLFETARVNGEPVQVGAITNPVPVLDASDTTPWEKLVKGNG